MRQKITEAQLHRIIKESVKRVLKESNNEKEYCVQQTIGGWRQNPVMYGTYEECCEYYDTVAWGNNHYEIVPADEVEVDYLDDYRYGNNN